MTSRRLERASRAGWAYARRRRNDFPLVRKETMLRKVLVIAYHFPPCDNPAGSARSEAFVRHLPRYGWEPHVLAAANDGSGGEMHPSVRRVRSWTPWTTPFHLAPFGWGPAMAREARRWLAEQPFDALYASFPPTGHASFVTRLATDSGLPLVADFRDAWTLNPYRKDDLPNRLLALLAPAQEIALFKAASRILLNTPSALLAYRESYPALSGRFDCLPNGYDERIQVEDLQPVSTHMADAGEPLVLGYLGPFGVSGRQGGDIFAALSKLNSQGTTVRLRLIGDDSGATREAIARQGLSESVEQSPRLPAARALSELARCDVALLYQAPSIAPVSAVAGKTHEYLRLGKPILAVAPAGDNLDLLRQAAGDLEVVEQPATTDAIALALSRLTTRKRDGLLPRFVQPSGAYLATYSRMALTERLASCLDQSLDDVSPPAGILP